MKIRVLSTFFFLALATGWALQAQGWDPARAAQGWAFQDVDGSLFFYDAGTRSLRQWQKGGGLLASQSLPLPEPPKTPKPQAVSPVASNSTAYEEAGALLYGIPKAQRATRKATPSAAQAETSAPSCEAVPERWVLDTYNRVWVICENRLVVISKDGKLEATYPLPGEVEDLAAGRDGIFLNYRTLRPYVEKRGLRNGDVAWAYGDKAALAEAAASPLLVPRNRMAVSCDGSLYLAEGGSLTLTVLDAEKGPKAPGQSFFTYRDSLPARANLGRTGRGALLCWAGRQVLFSAFDPAQLRGTGAPDAKGMVLARFDLARGTLDWIPTGLTEGHRLVGLLDHEAVFLNPEGGLSYAPIH